MAQLDVRREYADGEILLASDLDAFLNDIETFLNIIGINDDNIQDGGINATTKIADATVTTAKLANGAVTTAKIADSAVTAAKLAADSVTTAKIVDAAVTTAKIADSAITIAKVADSTKYSIKTYQTTSLTSTGNYTVPAGVYTLFVSGISNNMVFGGLTFGNIGPTSTAEVTRIFSVAPADVIAYNAQSGTLVVWY